MASLPTEHPSLGSPSWPQLTITSKSRRGRVSGQLVYVLCVWARGDACRAGCGVRVCAWARGDAAQPRSPAHMYCTRALSLTRALSRIAADALARIGSGGSQVHSPARPLSQSLSLSKSCMQSWSMTSQSRHLFVISGPRSPFTWVSHGLTAHGAPFTWVSLMASAHNHV